MKSEQVFEIGDLVSRRAIRNASTGVIVSKSLALGVLQVRWHDGYINFIHEKYLTIEAKAK